MADSPTYGEATAPTNHHSVQDLFTDSLPRTLSVPPLPAELWGQICKLVDHRTLCMIIRPVSRMLFSEAEREMKKSRLPKLRVNWTFRAEYGGGEYRTQNHLQQYRIQGLSHFSEDDQRVYFTASDGFCGNAPRQEIRIFPWDYLMKKHQLDKVVRDLTYKNSRTDARNLEHLDDRSVVFAGQSFLLEIPGLKIDFHEANMSFEWRMFLTAFFDKFAPVRSANRNITLNYERRGRGRGRKRG